MAVNSIVLSPDLLSFICNANAFTFVVLVYYFKILFSRLVRSFEWIVFQNKKAASLTTCYFSNDDFTNVFPANLSF
ncbi:hypothetical protein SORDD27_00692 [Streptococcus oralis]|uniref:Uncharacterized protein n=1 Tax=Streptococcus oralis TaxID=1303 RepID=A0A139PYC9_STROR|nr:hypothetical protein SORDD27_00692 [Streptococcus oralis]